MDAELFNKILCAALEDRRVWTVHAAALDEDFSGLLDDFTTHGKVADDFRPVETLYLLSMAAVRGPLAAPGQVTIGHGEFLAKRKGGFVVAVTGPRLHDDGVGRRNVLERTLDALNAGKYAPAPTGAVAFDTETGYALRFETHNERAHAMGDLAAVQYLREAAARGEAVRLEIREGKWICSSGTNARRSHDPAWAVVDAFGQRDPDAKPADTPTDPGGQEGT